MLTQAQKQARLGRITSSVAAAALGLDDWSSPFDAQQRIKGEGAAIDGNAATERGNLLEAACIDFVVHRTGLRAISAPFVDSIAPWSGDSTDALLLDAEDRQVAAVEAKTVGLHGMDRWGEEGTDDVPERVMVQCHWHLIHHPEAQTCYVPVLFGGDFVFKLYEVPRHQAFAEHIWRQAEAWHARHIAGDEPVPLGHTKADRRALLERDPRDWDETLIEASEELQALIERRVAAAEALKQADRELSLCNNLLRDAIGPHAGIDAAALGYSVTYRKNKDGAQTDWQAVARALGASEALIYEHTKVAPGDRVLRVARKRTTVKKGETE